MDERPIVRDLENNFLFPCYPKLYKYDYPDTGKRTNKKKPPDSSYTWKGYHFVIEYKIKGKAIKPHQAEELVNAYKSGALAFTGIIQPDKSIIFFKLIYKENETIELIYNDKKSVKLKYQNGWENVDKLLYNLRSLYND